MQQFFSQEANVTVYRSELMSWASIPVVKQSALVKQQLQTQNKTFYIHPLDLGLFPVTDMIQMKCFKTFSYGGQFVTIHATL